MIRQFFYVENYWKAIVYYNIDYAFFNEIREELLKYGASKEDVESIKYQLKSGKAKACTFSNGIELVSIVLFNRHTSKEDYLNSLVHEAEHIKQAMLKAYNIEDASEPPAYTIGYLISQMYKVFKDLICNCDF